MLLVTTATTTTTLTTVMTMRGIDDYGDPVVGNRT